MESNSIKDHIIYLLKTSPQMPSWYIDFANDFHFLGIKVIPILIKDLESLVLSESRPREHIIILTTGLSSKEYFEKNLQKFLIQMIKNRKAYLYHLSSFENNLSVHLSYLKNNYFFARMPADLLSIVQQITKIYLASEQSRQLWPGGTKAKLPPSTIKPQALKGNK